MDIGRINTLRVDRFANHGAYLLDTEKQDVLLPGKYIPHGTNVGDKIDVFVYRDSEDRLIATTLKPMLQVEEFGFLKVKDVNKIGAFLDWGIEKDLLVPFREQVGKMVKGKSYLIYLFLDEKTHRLVATEKIKPHFEKHQISLEPGDQVDLLIGASTDLGIKVIVNNRYEGLLFHNEVFDDLMIGDRTSGYVKNVREDGKVDVSLQQQGMVNLEAGAQKILNLLAKDGFLPLTDKSDPDDIQMMLQMSKKNFKRSLGILYKQRLVKLEESGIRKL